MNFTSECANCGLAARERSAIILIVKTKNKFQWLDLSSYIPLVISAIAAVVVVAIVYSQTRQILENRLKERLISIVSTAALQFNGDRIASIRDEEARNTQAFKEVIEKMRKIRDANENLRYIYIWRKTDQPNILQFVADAEMLNPIDIDGNGVIEDEEVPPGIGEDYDITDTPEVYDAFETPQTTREFIVDRWGAFASGWAPIRDSNNNVVAVLGIDVLIEDFTKIVSATLIPFVLLAGFLLILLSIQTLFLVRIWKSRVSIIQELDRQKDELLSLVSHQLATPISSLKWYLEMMKDGDLGKLTEEQKKHVQTMQDIGDNLSELVNMILDVSRIQLGRMQVEKQELNLQEFIDTVIKEIEPKISEKKLHFTKKLPNHWPIAKLDRKYTHMVLQNLLTNAVKYTPEEGAIELLIEIHNGILHCEVKDGGCGIPDEDKIKIFGRMYRASNVRNAVEGNGFGLFISKGAVEAQGGKIWFESEVGRGSKFSFELPLK